MLQSLGGSCLSSHTGVKFFCSATRLLSLFCNASCNRNVKTIKNTTFKLSGDVLREMLRSFNNTGFLQFYLGLYATVLLPLLAVIVVFSPLLAGWGTTIGIVMVKMISKTFAVPELTPIVFTVSWWLKDKWKKNETLKI